MSGVIKCPNCKTPQFVADEMIGRVIACPTCQRPIELVGQTQPAPTGGAASPAKLAASAAGQSRLPQAAPLAPAPALSLEPAPAAPKYSAEVSQLALAPVTSAPPPPKKREETVSPVVLITWAVLGLLVVGSGIIVAVASFKGFSHEPAAVLPKGSVPPAPPSQRSFSRPFSAPPKGANDSDDPIADNSAASASAVAPSAPAASERPAPHAQRAMPSVLPTQSQPPRPFGAPGAPGGLGPSSPPPTLTNAANASPPAASAPATNPPPASASAPSASPVNNGPLSGLGDAWRLPALISTADEPLASLSADPTEPLNVSLSSTAAAIGEQAAIFVERIESGLWTVFYVADLQMPEAKTPLGTLRLTGRQFSFAWKSLELPELRRQVANCRLIVHHGEERKPVQLRAAQQEAAIKLNLEKANQIREITIADLPKLELLRLEINTLDGFEGSPNVIVKSLPLGKETKIEFAEPPGAEIQVRFQKLPTGNLAVRLEPIFREGESKEFDLTLPRLKAMEDGVTRALRTAERELPAEKRELAGKELALRKLKGSQPSNPLAIPGWKQAVNDMVGDVDRSSRKVARLTNDIPVFKARLEAVPKIRDFLTKMNQSATIRLRIVAECGEHDLVLVEAAADPQSAE
jgi:hypothetical protein